MNTTTTTFDKPLGSYENGESLFWKVFNNKYLLNFIINKIQRLEWELYDDYYQIHAENKWKFKDIYSFDWMILNQQFPLLKNKIENNDFILFDKKSIDVLFKEFSSGTKKVKTKSTDLDNNNNNNNKNKGKDEKSILALKEIIILLLEKRRNEFEICDLTKSAIIGNSIEGIKILINEPYCIKVYPSTIELAFEKCDSEMIKTLLLNENKNNNILFNNEIKKKSFKLALKNTSNCTEIVQFLLENPNLYILPSSLPISLSPLNDTNNTNINSNEEKDKNKIIEHYLTYQEFKLLSSIQTKKNLLDLNIVLKSSLATDLKEVYKFTDTIDDLLIKLEVNLKYCHDYYDGIPKTILKKINQILNCQSASKENKLKKIQRLIIIISRDVQFYNDYILKYEESINEFHYDSYFSNDEDQEKDIDQDEDEYEESKLITFSRYILNGFLYDSKLTLNRKMDKVMRNFKEKKIKWHKPLFKLLNSDSDLIIIKDKSTFDWIKSIGCDVVDDYFSKKQFEFESFETSVSFFNNNDLSTTTTTTTTKYSDRFSFFKTPYLNAIKECNLDQLKTIDSFETDPFLQYSIDSISFQFSVSTTKDDLVKLINYFSDSNFKAFTKELLISFFDQVFKTGLVSPSDIKIKIPIDITLPNEIILDSLFDLDLKLLELLLNSLDALEFKHVDYDRLDSIEKNLYSKELTIFHNDPELIDFKELYRLMEFIINKFIVNKRNIKASSDVTKTNNEIESAIELLNYLYQMLLQREFVTPKQVTQAYQLFQLHSVPVEHSLFNAFYYLQIRSPKFTKYMLSRPGIDSFFEINFENSYNCSTDYSEGINHFNQHGFELGNHLKIESFTFDYVLGANEKGDYNIPFDQVLYQLVFQLSHSLIDNIEIIDDFISLSFNADLEYCLDIRRVDLFFRQLEFIKRQIEPTNADGYEYRDENQSFPFQDYVYNSPATNLLPTSELFSNREQPPMPPMPQSKVWNSEIPFPSLRYFNTFKISNSVLDLAMIVMDVDEIQKLIEWNWHKTTFQSAIFSKSIFWSKFDVTEHMLKNYKIPIFSLPHLLMTTHYSYLLEFNYFIKNHFELVQNPNLFKIDLLKFDNSTFPIVLTTNLIDYLTRCSIDEYRSFMDIKYREMILDSLIYIVRADYGKNVAVDDDYFSQNREDLIVPLIESKESQEMLQRVYDRFKIKNDEMTIAETQQQIKDYSSQNDNMFTNGFIVGDITICQLILKHYPNLFKITQHAITMAIKADKIHIIKFYYHNNNNNLIINLKDDKPLLDHLKSELLNHQDYKFDINWLN
ncbi:hypothetical protein ACTFIV_011185 [Dictyostelium citrinum]